jgi:hypothetical protein
LRLINQSKAAKVITIAISGSAPVPRLRCFWVSAGSPEASWRVLRPNSRQAMTVATTRYPTVRATNPGTFR